METQEYNNYVERWKKYWKREKEYYEKRMEYIRDEKEYLLPDLDERYGHGKIDSPYQFGPFTIIRDQADLLNHNFILPGLDSSFLDLTNTDKNIPFYFGKKLLVGGLVEGIVVGYGYDAYDDYIRVQDDNGKIKNILVNSDWFIK